MSFRQTVLAVLLAGSSGMPTSTPGGSAGCGGGSGVQPSRPTDHACAKAGVPRPIEASTLDNLSPTEVSVGREAYSVRLAAVNGAYEGALQFTPTEAATYDIYVGTPNIPFRVVWRESDRSGYLTHELTPAATTPITDSECTHLRKVTSYELGETQTAYIQFGPTTDVRFVRLYVDVRTASTPRCEAGSLAQQSEACAAASDGARALTALPLGMSVVAPVFEADTVYDVDLPAVLGTDTYAGALLFHPPTSDNYELYLDDPSVPLRIQGGTAVCSQDIPATACGPFRRGTRFALNSSLGEYAWMGDREIGYTFRVEFGPSARRNVRVTMRQVTAVARPIKLGPAQICPAPSSGSAMTAGDLDGDGALDLIVSSPNDASGDNALDLLRGSGRGAFMPVAHVAVSAPSETVVSDFNRDGIADIMAVGWDGQGPLPWSYLRGLGDFKYERTLWRSSIDFNTTLSTGDFDEDGVLDLIGSWPSFAALGLFPGSPYFPSDPTTAGGFVIATMPSMTIVQREAAFGIETAHAVAGDFNGDGHEDVIAASSMASAMKLYLGDGSGTVAFANDIALPGRGISKLAAFDLDRDGDSELIAVHHGLMITISHGSALGLSSPPIVVPTGHNLRGFAFGDFDHDGRTDLTVRSDERAIQVFFANDSGYRLGGELAAPPGYVPICSVAGDFTGDGFDDLAVTMFNESSRLEPIVAFWPSTP